MNALINLYASASGLWKKIASWLPLICGAGSFLAGAGGLLSELGHAANAAAMLAIVQNLQADPNTALILAGLAGMGIHTNHAANAAVIADHSESIGAISAGQDNAPKL